MAGVRRVAAGENLQIALNAAVPGDEIRLTPGATYSGNFVLPVFAGTTAVIVRTDLSDAALPPANQRVTPATAAGFARIVSPNTGAALRTAPGAHDWTLMFLEFPATRDGFGDIIQLGDGSGAQSQLSQVPSRIVLDRVYVHGDPLRGQKRGIALNAATVTIRNCYVADIKAVGADTQAIGGWNGPGPFSIENNYLEASGEVFLLGGSDPAIPNLVTEDVAVRYNHLSRPMSWRDPIIAAPGDVAATAQAGGTLPAGTYAYRVVARRPVGQGNVGTSAPSAEAVVSAGGDVTLVWAAVPDATEYRVYGRTPAAASQYWTVTAPTFTDSGAAGTPGAPPSEGTRWQVKNIFELKNARRVQVEYNLIENNWLAAQAGYAVLLTPRNQDGGCPQCVVESVDFTHNIVRNTAAGVNILGYDNNNSSRQTRAIHLADNLFYAVSTAYGGNGWAVLIGDEPADVVLDHNTFDHDGTSVLYAYGGTAAAPRAIAGFRFTNNAAQHGDYGISGADASPGTLTLQMYFPGAVISGNWLSGGNAAMYPPGNRFDVPFDAGLGGSAGANATAPAYGANVARLRLLLDSVVKGAMTGLPPAPKNLRIISSGR